MGSEWANCNSSTEDTPWELLMWKLKIVFAESYRHKIKDYVITKLCILYEIILVTLSS